MRPSTAITLALGAVLATTGCEKPTVKGPPKPVYISVGKDGKLRICCNLSPRDLAEFKKLLKVSQ